MLIPEVPFKLDCPNGLLDVIEQRAEDLVFCLNLGRHAVHAGMAGKTGMVVDLWRSVVELTGQPAKMGV